jgi:SAM-dependent methyltransferase
MLKSTFRQVERFCVRKICELEFQRQVFTESERTIEYRFALQALGEKRPKTILDVGTGASAWPALLRNCGYVVTSIDNIRDYYPGGEMANRHWAVLDVDILNPGERLQKKFDAITCISVLEHIPDHVCAVRNMVALLEPGGILILTVPYSHYNPHHPNVYKHPDAKYGKHYPYICQSFSETDLNQWLALNLTLEKRELWRLFSGPVWATGEYLPWEQAATEREPHQLGCFVFHKGQSQ